MAWNVILFDLDGTLTDPKVGICSAVRHALGAFGIEVASLDELTAFIGPPLHDAFPEYYGFDAAQTELAVEKFREYFSVRGWAENEPYPGIGELLTALRGAGKRLIVATSKPENFAVRILEHFGLAQYFELICGAPEDDIAACAKSEVIRSALKRAGIDTLDGIVMVGDRRHDVQGAHTVGLPVIGVLYGYGGRGELTKAGADYLAADLGELRTLLLGD